MREKGNIAIPPLNMQSGVDLRCDVLFFFKSPKVTFINIKSPRRSTWFIKWVHNSQVNQKKPVGTISTTIYTGYRTVETASVKQPWLCVVQDSRKRGGLKSSFQAWTQLNHHLLNSFKSQKIREIIQNMCSQTVENECGLGVESQLGHFLCSNFEKFTQFL